MYVIKSPSTKQLWTENRRLGALVCRPIDALSSPADQKALNCQFASPACSTCSSFTLEQGIAKSNAHK